MWSRRQFLTRGTAGLLGTAGAALGMQSLTHSLPGTLAEATPGLQDAIRENIPDGSQAKGMITEETDLSIQAGLRYLERHQYDNGSFGTNQYAGNIAVTSLGALAFLAGGHLPGRSPQGRIVVRALEYVLSQEKHQPSGFLHQDVDRMHGWMYGHGFGTLFLAEVHGALDDPNLRERARNTLKRAVDLILRSQNREGAWRYYPHSPDSDISVTICQIMALRAARNAGIFVPKTAVDRCVDYVRRCQNKEEGWFKYRATDWNFDNRSFARTAAGVAAFFSAGIYTGPEVTLALKYLQEHCLPHGMPPRPDMYYFYGHYYAAQAMWTAGGRYWSEWFPAIRDELVLGQQRGRFDGAWPDQVCAHYSTAMACIILQIPNNYLPILQK